jgi:hypothetical protein
MSDLQKQIDTAYSNIKSLEPLYADVFARMDAAKAAGDARQEDALAYEYDLLQKEETRLQQVYGELSEEQSQPERKRISETGAKLRQEKVYSNFMPAGMGSAGMPGMTAFSGTPYQTPSDIKIADRQMVAERYKIPLSPGGMESEKIPTSLMAQVETLQDPTSKAQLLENTYGKGSVLPIDISGKTEFFIKQSDGSVKTTMDKGIAGLAGVAVETPAVLGEIASFLAITGATKSPAAGVAGSAAVGAGIGALTDEMLRYAYNLEPDIGGTLARRGGQAVMSAGIGMGTDVVIPAMRAARMKNPFENVFSQALESAQERLMTAEQRLAAREGRKAGKIEVPLGAKLAGPEGVAMQSELAGKYPGSNIASNARSTQETLLRLSDDFRKGIPAVLSDFSDIAARKLEQRNNLAQEISSTSLRNKRIVENSLDRLTRGPISDTDTLGKILRSSIKDAEDQASALVSKRYDDMATLADNAGFSITPAEMLDKIAEVKRNINPSQLINDTAVNRIEENLRARIAAPLTIKNTERRLRSLEKIRAGTTDPDLVLQQNIKIQKLENELLALDQINKDLNFTDFNNLIREFGNLRPDGAVGGTTGDLFGLQVSNALSKVRSDLYSQYNAVDATGVSRNLGQEFAETAKLVQGRGQFEKGNLGYILKEAAGEASTEPRAIVDRVMRDPENIRKVTQVLRELGSDPAKAGEADRILGLMQVQYMNDIGLGAGKGSPVKIDDGFLDALFGSQAPAQKRVLLELNQNLRNVKGLNKADLTLEDIKRMGQPLSEQERKSLIKTIVKRNQFQKEQSDMLVSDIFDAAEKGRFENLDADSLSAAILSDKGTLRTQYAMRELSKSSLDARNLYRGDFMRYILDQFPGGTASANAPFQAPFDTRKFIEAYGPTSGKGVTPFAQKLKIVLGEDKAQHLYDIASLWNANIIKNSSDPTVIPRAGLGAGTSFLYIPVGQMAESAKNRILTAMLSADVKSTTLTNALKTSLARNAMPGAINDVYNQMAREMFMTRQGVTALANQAKDDPEFSLYLTNMAKEFKEKQGLDFATDLIKMDKELERQQGLNSPQK